MPLPFPYWDPDLREWLDDHGHCFEVRFRAVPDDEALKQLGRLCAEHFHHGPAAPSAWDWSGPFARFEVALRWSKAHPAVFDQVGEFLLKAHAIASIREVLMLDGVNRGADNLDAGPTFESPVRRVDPTLPHPGPHPAFDAGRNEVEARQMDAAQKEEEAKLEALLVAPKPGKVGLRRFEITPLPAQEDYPACLRERFDPEQTFFAGPVSAPYVFSKSQFLTDQSNTLSWFGEDGRARQVSFPQPISPISPRSDGLFALVWIHTHDNQLYEVDLTSGESIRLWTGGSDGPIQSVHYLDNDTWAVSFKKRLYVLQRSGEGVRELARGASMGDSMVIVAGGRLLIRAGLKVYLWTGKKVKLVGKFDAKEVGFHAEKSGEIIMRIGSPGFYLPGRLGDVHGYLALTRLDEVLKTLEARPKKRAPKQKAPKITLEQIPVADVPPLLEISGKDRVRVTKGRKWGETAMDGLARPCPTVVQSESGRMAASVGEGVTYLDDAKKQQLVPVAGGSLLRRLVVEPGGACAFVQVGDHTLHQADFDDGKTGKVAFIGSNCGALADFAAMDANNVVMLGERKLLWMKKLEGEWLEVDERKISAGRRIYWSTELKVAVVLTEAKGALQVWAPLGEKLVKLAQFTEKVKEVRISGDAAYVLWPEQGQAFVLTNVAQVRVARAGMKED